jgi:hypothetical protein
MEVFAVRHVDVAASWLDQGVLLLGAMRHGVQPPE